MAMTDGRDDDDNSGMIMLMGDFRELFRASAHSFSVHTNVALLNPLITSHAHFIAAAAAA